MIELDGKVYAKLDAGAWKHAFRGWTGSRDHAGKLSRTGSTRIGGVRTTIITDRGRAKGSTPRRFYVSASGPARLVQTGKRRAGGRRDKTCKSSADTTRRMDLRFSRFGEAFADIVAPESTIPWPIG